MGVWRLLVLLLSACIANARTFHDGEYVTTARRSQFRQVLTAVLVCMSRPSSHVGKLTPTRLPMQQRTEWHDLLGRYCPRFGRHQVVTIPIQRPSKWVPEDDYKLMLSFDCAFPTSHW